MIALTIFFISCVANNSKEMLNKHRSEKVVALRTHACHLISDLVILPTEILKLSTLGAADRIEHWWFEIETENFYFNSQFWKSDEKDSITITVHGSSEESDEEGLKCAGRLPNDSRWTIPDTYYIVSDNITMAPIIDWIQETSVNSQYNLIFNNCQKYCKTLFRFIRSQCPLLNKKVSYDLMLNAHLSRSAHLALGSWGERLYKNIHLIRSLLDLILVCKYLLKKHNKEKEESISQITRLVALLELQAELMPHC